MPSAQKTVMLTNRCKIIVRGLLNFTRQGRPRP
ncbi:hypothetical protein DFAR_3540002 [Desulfarculales bacterium]